MKLMTHVKRGCCALVMLAALSGTVMAATPKEVLSEAAGNLASHPEGVYTLHVGTQIPFAMTAAVNETLSVQMTPFRIKGHADVNSTGLLSFSGRADVYAEQIGDTLAYYYHKNDERWKSGTEKLKDAVPLAEKVGKQKVTVNQWANVEEIRPNTYTTTVDLSQLDVDSMAEHWKNSHQAAGVSEKDMENALGILNAIKQSGSVTATVYVDPAIHKITHVEIPLTGQLRGILNYALTMSGSLTPEEQAVGRQIAEYSTGMFTLDYTELSADVDLRVPDYVKEQAGRR